MVEDAIVENSLNPEAVRELEIRKKKEIKELVQLQNMVNSLEYAHVFLSTEDP